MSRFPQDRRRTLQAIVFVRHAQSLGQARHDVPEEVIQPLGLGDGQLVGRVHEGGHLGGHVLADHAARRKRSPVGRLDYL
eukprot:scaffold92546_cov48-Prasinocladus_malaysianus.AAC.2